MLEIFSGSDAMADAAAQAVAAQLAAGLAARGRASLVATGGRSPGPVYDRLKDAPLDWAHVAVTLSDERQVDIDSPNANVRQLRERLFVGEAARAQYLPLTDYAEPALKKLMPFDAVMLGMGEDGHVASLFPGAPAEVTASSATCIAVIGPKPPPHRVTLTYPAILAARAVWVIVSGAAKENALRNSLSAGAITPLGRVLANRVATIFCAEVAVS